MAEKKASKKTTSKKSLQQYSMYGSIAFGVGLAIAVIAGLINLESSLASKIVGATLVVLGLAVGILNITKEEAIKFMIASLVIITLIQPFLSGVIEVFGINSQTLTGMLRTIFVNITTFIVPAAFVVALKSAFEVAKDED